MIEPLSAGRQWKNYNSMKRILIIILHHALLGLSIVCLLLSLIPIRDGILLPVHRKDQKMIYINDAGAVVHPDPWLHAGAFDDKGLAHVTITRKNCHLINRAGKISKCRGHIQYSLSHPDHSAIGPDSQGMILLRDPGKCRWILKNQQAAIPGIWDAAHPFQGDQPAAVCKNGYWGFIDRTGKVVLPFHWDGAFSFDESGVARACRNQKWGLINTEGNWIVRPHYRELSDFDSHGLAAATSGNCAGFINRKGKIVIPLRFETVTPFDDGGLAKVVKKTDWSTSLTGWIDRNGREVIPCQFEGCGRSQYFRKHPTLFEVNEGLRSGLIDRNGNWVVSLGDGNLRIINDPMAPGREWYARAPVQNGEMHPMSAAFQPACYDQQGRIIWSGTQISWRMYCRYSSYILACCWAFICLVKLWKSKGLSNA